VKLPNPKKLLASFLLISGLLIIASIVAPISMSLVGSILFPTIHPLDPSVTGDPSPIVVNSLGAADTSYNSPQTWFTGTPPAANPISTPIKYYTLTYSRLNIFDIPIEISGENLEKNAIQYPGTALPGSYGNTVIFGHSALPQFYNPSNPFTVFNHLPEARVGDEIIINYDGVTYRYQARELLEVKPTQIEVLSQRFDRHELTLITCVPLGTYWNRFVLRAELVN
jgi:sortase A